MTYTGSNIKYLRNRSGWSQSKLGLLLGGIDKSTVHHWEAGRNLPQIAALHQMAEMWNTTIDEILNVDMKSTSFTSGLNCRSKNVDLNDEPVYVTKQNSKRSLLVPVTAQAGYLHEWPDVHGDEESPVYINIPGIEGESRTFEIEGDSMYPILESSDYIVCSRVESPADIREGTIYVVISLKSGISAKYLRLLKGGIMLIPANTDVFSQALHPYDDIKEIWEAKARITRKFTNLATVRGLTSEAKRLDHIEAFISTIFPDFKQDEKDFS